MENFSTKYGHFSENGNEYVITSYKTPKPWINVISNGEYGVITSQAGGGFSWLNHSEFNRITRWHQDLVQDNWGKYIYIKNNKTGETWSPTWLPVKTELDSYECKFGFGYSVYTTEYKSIKVELTIFVPFDDSLEIWDIKIINYSHKELDLSFFTYFEWCLGSSADHHREFHRTFLETRFDKKLNSIVAGKRIWEIPLGDRGHWNTVYEYKGFFASNKKITSFECDKEKFLGQYGSLSSPVEVSEGKLSNTSGTWYDPIGSLKIDVHLNKNEEVRFAFYLGLKKDESDIGPTLRKYKSAKQIDNALEKVKTKWQELLSTLVIETPDGAMNLLVNKWLRYQAISGRLWGRTAYYQQSGAFGFRDQLQDSLVFLPINPSATENQIKLHARHQLKDGTVLHWWHPITETGLPTKMTDDLLWLPFLIIEYLKETNNYNFLDEKEPYYNDKEKNDSLFNHCKKAINKVLQRISKRGLPLIGAGDWNDGLSAVGLDMKGESIWLTEFLYYILINFEKIAIRKGRKRLAKRYSEKAKELKKAFDNYAWDGEWFWRATKDSGEKIGSSENDEGKIYLNTQSWAVISSIAEEEKQKIAIASVSKYLLKNNGALLLYPAYTKPDKYIGYLSRYAAGRRENGGVYSHAAVWAIWAYSLLKDSELAFKAYKNLCPIYNGMNPEKYAAEPYVTPGNIDGPDSPNYGMAGWTWYTGSASWFQKICVEWILGVRATEEGLLIDPCIPKEWNSYSVKRTFRGCIYNIKVLNPEKVSFGVKKIIVDGIEQSSNLVVPQKKKNVTVNVFLGK
jgi:cellobiose phosphorylase